MLSSIKGITFKYKRYNLMKKDDNNLKTIDYKSVCNEEIIS